MHGTPIGGFIPDRYINMQIPGLCLNYIGNKTSPSSRRRRGRIGAITKVRNHYVGTSIQKQGADYYWDQILSTQTHLCFSWKKTADLPSGDTPQADREVVFGSFMGK